MKNNSNLITILKLPEAKKDVCSYNNRKNFTYVFRLEVNGLDPKKFKCYLLLLCHTRHVTVIRI